MRAFRVFLFFLVLLLVLAPLTHSLNNPASFKSRLRYFVNLTNGIEAMPLLLAEKGLTVEQMQFVRIQSSHCERADHVAIIQNLDYNFLMNLALGNIVVMYDFGSRGTGIMTAKDNRFGIPRSMWWGTEFIRHALEVVWKLPVSETRMVKGYNAAADFNYRINSLPKNVKKRLKYFRRFVQTDRLYWYNAYCRTEFDGEKEWYATTLRKIVPPMDLSASPDIEVSIDSFVEAECLPQSMFLYRHTDFEGFGRSTGFVSDE